VLTAAGIYKKYGERPVIENLDLVLEKKREAGRRRRNGAGKSTLLRIIAGLDPDFQVR